MGIVDTITETLKSSRPHAPDEGGDDGSSGAYWCDDCGVRVRDVDVDDEGLPLADDGTPECPDCGDQMRFERSHAGGCAC